MHIVVRKVSGQRMVVDLEDLEELSICEVKQLVEIEWSDLESDQMVLIFKGKILKDDDVVNEMGIKDGATLILTMKKSMKKAAPKPKPAPAPAPPANPMMTPQMQQMLNNPFMQQMMDNLMSNPDFMEAMLANNPQMQQVMQSNPELRHALRDPDTMRQAMQMLRDPLAMQEALQNQDRAIANISNMPGGFNALSRMYNQIQAPMEDAMTMRDPSLDTTISEVDTSTGPNSNAMPNPFAATNNGPSPARSAPTPARSAPTSNPNLNANLFANFGTQNAQPNPFMNFGFPFAPPQNQNQPSNNTTQPFAQANTFAMPSFFSSMPQPNRFSNQLAYLRSQGYTNDAENQQALEETNGNLELAIAILLANRDE